MLLNLKSQSPVILIFDSDPFSTTSSHNALVRFIDNHEQLLVLLLRQQDSTLFSPSGISKRARGEKDSLWDKSPEARRIHPLLPTPCLGTNWVLNLSTRRDICSNQPRSNGHHLAGDIEASVATTSYPKTPRRCRHY